MRCLITAWMMLCLTGCAQTGGANSVFRLPALPPPSSQALNDVPSEAALFALPDAALNYIDTHIARQNESEQRRLQALGQWLTAEHGLRPVYDSSYTRTTAQTLESRAGNCLSLAMLTAAVAQHLGLTPVFRQPDLPYIWDQSGGLERVTHHVNIVVLPPQKSDRYLVYGGNDFLLIDFINSPALRLVKSHSLSAAQIANLYYANRAGELLSEGKLDTAYAHVYTAISRDPQFIPAYATLGVLLRRKGHDELAEQVYLAGLKHQPHNPSLLNNLMVLYDKQGEQEKAQHIQHQLTAIEADNPFRLARQAEAAYQAKAYHHAKQLYQQALAKADYIDDFHFGLAKVYWQLGEFEQVKAQLTLAQQKSLSSETRQRYVAKLAHLAQYLM